MQYFPWNERLQVFKGTLDRIVVHLEFRTVHEYNSIARILEQKALFLRYEASELLREKTEVPTMCQGFERSGELIDSGRGRVSSITHE